MTYQKVKRLKTKKSNKLSNFAFFFVILLFAFCFLNLRQANATVAYPIIELGNCSSARECFYYCQIPKNTPACWAYGKINLKSQVLGVTDASSSAMAKKFGFSFPVAELGFCADAVKCREYCSLKENYAACSVFAQKTGLNKLKSTSITPADMKKIFSSAKKELRCATNTACRNFCQIPENSRLCTDFAIKYKMIRDRTLENHTMENKLLGYAKSELGCTSYESCHLFCDGSVNRERCLRFSRKFVVSPEASGAAVPVAEDLNRQSNSVKLPCTQDESCRLYCQNNPGKCLGFDKFASVSAKTARQIKPLFQPGDFIGPDGCRTDLECNDFCNKYPDECRRNDIVPVMTLKPTVNILPSRVITITPFEID